jgi:hypothetical protein
LHAFYYSPPNEDEPAKLQSCHLLTVKQVFILVDLLMSMKRIADVCSIMALEGLVRTGEELSKE